MRRLWTFDGAQSTRLPNAAAIRDASAFLGDAIFVDEAGLVFRWSGLGSPRKVRALAEVRQVSCSLRSRVALTSAGAVYQWTTRAPSADAAELIAIGDLILAREEDFSLRISSSGTLRSGFPDVRGQLGARAAGFFRVRLR